MAVSVEEFEKALKSLDESVRYHANAKDPATQKMFRDACIQRFEYSIELAWKTAGKVMGSKSNAANTVIREMARDGLVSEPELWFGFIAARNQTSHTYDEDIAQTVFTSLIQFLPHGQKLLLELKLR